MHIEMSSLAVLVAEKSTTMMMPSTVKAGVTNGFIGAGVKTSYMHRMTRSIIHRDCTGMSKKAYDLLTAEDSAEWACDTCIAVKTIPTVKMVTKS